MTGIQATGPVYVDDPTGLISALEGGGAAGRRWNHQDGEVGMGTPVVVSYAFAEGPELPAPGEMPYAVDNVYAFTEAQRDNFRLALDMIEEVCGVVFVEVQDTSLAQIDVMAVTGSIYAGWADYPSEEGGALVINGIGAFAPGSYDFFTILHELGHSLGLEHPFDGQIRLDPSLDTTDGTVMSYNGALFDYPEELQALDVAALQALYGPPETGFTIRELTRGVDLIGTVDDDDIIVGASDDWVKGGTGDDRIYLGGGRDHASAGGGDDLIDGGGGKDRIVGGDGDDLIRGGADADNLMGGNDDDVIYGDGGNDRLVGHYGVDLLYGGDGDDIIRDRGADDRAYGGAGDDLFYMQGGVAEGGAGDDRINHSGEYELEMRGGAGADLLFGSSGVDRYTFSEEDVGWLDIAYRFDARNDVFVIDGDWDASDRVIEQTGSNVLVTHGDLEFRVHGVRAEDADDWTFIYI